MKKTLLAVLLASLVSVCACLFSACNESYNDIKISFEQSEISIVMQDEKTEQQKQETKEGEESINSATFSVVVSVPTDRFSKVATCDVEDKSVAYISKTVFNGEKNIVTVVALAPGQTRIIAMTKEGLKKAYLNLNVILPATQMNFKPDFSMAVAVNEERKLDASLLTFLPFNSNQTNVKYSLKDGTPSCVSIDENNIFLATEQVEGGFVDIIATNVDNPELVATNRIYVYTPISKDDIKVFDVKRKIQIENLENIILARNSANNPLDIEISVGSVTENYEIFAQSLDAGQIVVQRMNENTFKVTGIESGKSGIKISVGIAGFKFQNYVELVLGINVIDIAQSVSINGSSKNIELNVYDYYSTQSDNARGAKIYFAVNPTTSQYSSCKIRVLEQYQSSLSDFIFSDYKGKLISDINDFELKKNEYIYVKTQNVGSQIELQFVANVDFDGGQYEVYNTITLNGKVGIKTIEFLQDEILCDLSKGQEMAVPCKYNGLTPEECTNIDFTQLSITTQSSGVVKCRIQDGRIFITPISVGETILTVRSVTQISDSIKTIVVIPGYVAMDVNMYKYLDTISQVEYDEQTNVLNAIKAKIGASFYLDISCYPTNTTYWSVHYATSDNRVVSVLNDGKISVLSNGVANLTVSGKSVVYNEQNLLEIKIWQQVIEIQGFRPITQFEIGKESARVFDVQTIGYLEASLYSAVAFDVIINDAYVKKDDVEFSIINDAKGTWTANEDGSWTYNGLNGVLIDYKDGTAKFIARLAKDVSNATVIVCASVKEFGHVFNSFCAVDITKAQSVEQILLEDYDNTQGIYFKGTENKTYQIKATAMPLNAINRGFYYIAWDYDASNLVDGRTPLTKDATSLVVSVDENGLVVPNSIGTAYVRVFPRSEIKYDANNDGKISQEELVENAMRANVYVDLVVNVADGSLENPFRINTLTDFLDIANGMQYHYVLASSIDLTNVESVSTMGDKDNPFTGSLSGDYILKGTNTIIHNKIYNLNLKCDVTYYEDMPSLLSCGLFGAIKGIYNYDATQGAIGWKFPSLKNVDISIASLELSIDDTIPDNTTIYFGIFAGLLEGQVSGCSVSLENNAIINCSSNNNVKLVLGGLFGQTNQQKAKDTTQEKEYWFDSEVMSCSFKAKDDASINLTSNNNLVTFGGLVGVNKCVITGTYKFVGNDDLGNEIIFVSYGNAIYDVFVHLDATLGANSKAIFGGVAGENYNKVSNLAVSGYMNLSSTSLNNDVGGIVGVNAISTSITSVKNAVVDDVLSSMCIIANGNVGGVVGDNKSLLNLAVCEFYQDCELNNLISGQGNIGGVVGVNSGDIDYAYFANFSKLNVAIVAQDGVVGGLVGLVNGGVITNSWTKATVETQTSVVGGLVGKLVSGELQNVYSQSVVNAIESSQSYTNVVGGLIGQSSGGSVAYSYSTSLLAYKIRVEGKAEQTEEVFNFVGQGASNVSTSYYLNNAKTSSSGAIGKTKDELQKKATYENWDFITSEWKFDSSTNDSLPYLIYISKGEVYDFLPEVPDEIMLSIARDYVENQFVKVDDKKAVIMLNTYSTLSQIAMTKEIALLDLLEIKTTPQIKRQLLLSVEIVEGADVVVVSSGNLKPLKEGYAKLKIASRLNPDAFDILEIYVVYGVSKMNLMTPDYKELSDLMLRKGTSLRIATEFENNVDGNKAQVNSKIGLSWKVENADEISLVYGEYDDATKTFFVSYDLLNIINGVAKTQQTIQTKAFVNVKFAGDADYRKIVLDWLAFDFDMQVYDGVSGVSLSQTSQSITPSDKLSTTATITTDVESDYINQILIKDSNGDTVQTVSVEYVNNNFVLTQSLEGEQQYFEVALTDVINDLSNNKMKYVFEFTPLEHFHSLKYDEIFTLDFVCHVVELFEEKTFSATMNLVINPQPILSVNMAHFESFGDGNIVSSEMSSNLIACGDYGLLKIDVYPHYANFDWLEIVSSNYNGIPISLQQCVYDQKQGVLVTKHNLSSAIDGGIRVQLVSGIDKNGNQYFDGTIWIKTLIETDIEEDILFDITTLAYIEGESEPVFTQNLSLWTDFSPIVKVVYPYESNQIARGSTVEFNIDVKTIGGTLSVNALRADGKEATGLIAYIDDETTFEEGVKVIATRKAKIFVPIEIQSGTEIQLTTTLKTTIDNLPYIRIATYKITVADFVVLGVSVQNQNNNIIDMNINGTFNLCAELEVQKYDSSYEGTGGAYIEKIDMAIANLQKQINAEATCWYNRVYESSTVSRDEVFLESGASLSVYSYKYVNNIDNKYFVLIGKKISNTAKVVVKVEIRYGFVAGVYSVILVNNSSEKETQYEQFEKELTLNIKDQSNEENPTPIYSINEFKEMQKDVHYILMEDLTFENWTPMTAEFASLDGNGKVIKLVSFSLKDYTGSDIGLFSTISENTIVKNVIVDLRPMLNMATSNYEFDLTNRASFNFGLFVGTNNGIVTNCEIMNIVSGAEPLGNASIIVNADLAYQSNYTNNLIGGFVGLNNGYITNSRVGRTEIDENDYFDINYCIKFIATSTMGGFAGQNNTIISSSFVVNIYLENTAKIPSLSKTAGFVANNVENARIMECFALGVGSSTKVVESEFFVLNNMVSLGDISGFVIINDGIIENCYDAFVMQTSSSSSGFVLDNTKSASISKCYAQSKCNDNNSSNSSFRAFTGVSDFGEVQNDGEIVNCYYALNKNDFQFYDEPATAISTTSSDEEQDGNGTIDWLVKENFVGFAFDISNANRNAVWKMGENAGPYLISANKISVSKRTLIEKVEGEQYIYTYDNGYELGSDINPILISSAERYNSYFYQANNAQGMPYVFEKNIKIIKDLNFASTSQTVAGAESSVTIFTGELDGNGMKFTGLTLKGNYNDTTSVSLKDKIEFGLFARIDGAIVKNLSLEFVEISATEFSIVGALAGVSVDSAVYDINLLGDGIVVQGKNIAGGLTGLVLGVSQITNITSNLSVVSTYRNIGHNDVEFKETIKAKLKRDQEEKDYTLYKIFHLPDGNDARQQYIENYVELKTGYNSYSMPNQNVSYSGGVIGAAVIGVSDDATSINQNEEIFKAQIISLKTYGQTNISGERVGGVIGYVSKSTKVFDLLYVLEYNSISEIVQVLSGTDWIGGIVAENCGEIEKARVEYTDEAKMLADVVETGTVFGYTNLFIGKASYIGGIVGKNKGGSLLECYSRANVVNEEAQYAGGVVGYAIGGKYEQIYVTGDIRGGVVGGFAGFVSGKDANNKISVLKNIEIVANYSFETAQYFNSSKDPEMLEKSVSVASLFGCVDADYDKLFMNGFEPERQSEKNYVVNIAYISTQKKDFVEFPSVATASVDAKTEVNTLLESVRTYVDDNLINRDEDGPITIKGIIADYEGLRDWSQTFAGFKETSWNVVGYTFPVLKIASQQNVIIISDSNKKDFFNLLDQNLQGQFAIACDINLNEDVVDFKSIGEQGRQFQGSIIGREFFDGTTLRLPKITLKDNTPLFNYFKNGSISNLNFVGDVQLVLNDDNPDIALVAKYANNCVFESLDFDAFNLKIISELSYETSCSVGTIVAQATKCSFKNIDVNNNIEFSSAISYKNLSAGGFVGVATNCKMNVGTFNGGVILKQNESSGINVDSLELGAIAGRDERFNNNASSYKNLLIKIKLFEVSINSVNGDFVYVGGLIGNAYYTVIENCNIIDEVYPQVLTFINNSACEDIELGGLVAYSDTITVSNSISYLEIICKDANDATINVDRYCHVGGGFGVISNSASLTNVNVKSNLTTTSINSKMIVGGLAGKLDVSNNENNCMTNCGYEGNISVVSPHLIVGGAIAECNAKISQIYVNSKITIGEINRSYTSAIVGGLVGSAKNSSINNCIFVGRMVLNENPSEPLIVGGLIGELKTGSTQKRESEIYYSYAVPYFTLNCDLWNKGQDNFVSGFLGKKYATNATLANCYYVLENSPQYDSTANGVSLVDLLEDNTIFTNSEIWTNQDGKLPYLKSIVPTNLDSGSLFNPITITQDNINAIVEDNGNHENNYNCYVVMEDIELKSSFVQSNFNGVFNGGGNVITLRANDAIFASVDNLGVIVNLNVIGVNKKLSSKSGNVATIANTNNGFVNYVSAKGQISTIVALQSMNIGGLIGQNDGYLGYSSSFVDLNLGEGHSSCNVGGLVGLMNSENSMITNCYSSGTIDVQAVGVSSGNNGVKVGGVVGSANAGSIVTVYANGEFVLHNSNADYYGAICGYIVDDTALYVHYAYNDKFGTLLNPTSENLKKNGTTISLKTVCENSDGGIVLDGFDKFVWSTYSLDLSKVKTATCYNYGYPYLKLSSSISLDYMNCGSGIKEKPISIKNQSGFEMIEYFSKGEKGYSYILEKDINFITSVPLSCVAGVIDGNGKTLYNISVVEANQNSQLAFIGENKAIIQNLTLKNVNISIPLYNNNTMLTVATLIAKNMGKISNCNVIESTINSDFAVYVSKVGGVVGENAGTIEQCVAEDVRIDIPGFTTISNEKNIYVGGLVGISSGKISQSLVRGAQPDYSWINIRGVSNSDSGTWMYVGAFVGHSSLATISNCCAYQSKIIVNDIWDKGSTIAQHNIFVGGFVGFAQAEVKNSYINQIGLILSATDVKQQCSYGRFYAGKSEGAIKDCVRDEFQHEIGSNWVETPNDEVKVDE